MKTRLVVFFCALVSVLCLTAGAGELDDLLTGNAPAMSFAPSYYVPYPYPCDYTGGGPPPSPWACIEERERHTRACKDRCDQMVDCTGPCAQPGSNLCTQCVANLATCKGAC